MMWLLVFWWLLAKPAMAGNLTISPPFSEVILEDGIGSKTIEIEVGNQTDKGLTFELEAVDFGSLDESGGVAFLTSEITRENKYGLASWISFENDKLLMAAGEKKKIKVTFLNREDMAPGGHYGAVLIKILTDENSGEKQVNLNQSYASLFYLEKTGGSRPDLKLIAAGIEKKKFGWPVKISLRFENNGNVHLIPRGRISLINRRETEVAFGIVNSESGLILPESFRKYGVNIARSRFFVWPGKYQIKTAYRYAGRENFDYFKSDFFYFGWEGVIIGLLFLTGLMMAGRKWLRKG